MYELKLQKKDRMTESNLPVRYSIHSFASLNITDSAKKRDYVNQIKRTYTIDNNIWKNIGQGE
jgi:hypothetical protein